jgi:peptidylprolyl isomerase domain and WD repeat-containing protein 1
VFVHPQGTQGTPPSNAVFDFSGHFLLYPTLCGIKVVNLETNRVSRLLGSGESNERFLAISLFQGTPKVSSQIKTGGKSGGVPISGESGPEPDPTVIAASFKRARFYLLSTRLPSDGS